MRLIGVKGPAPDVHLTAVPIKREWTVFHVSPSAVKKKTLVSLSDSIVIIIIHSLQ